MNGEPFPPGDPGLTQAILARTSGSPCRRLEALACDLADNLLDPAQTHLANGHLEHCPACRALVASLRELAATLPTLALLDPGPAFTTAVLQATVPASPPSFHAAWLRLMRRPRICLEAAYLGAVAGFIGLHAPLPTVRLMADSALVARLGNPVQRMAPALQARRAQIQACEQKAAVEASRQQRRLQSFWGRMVASLRSWLAWLEHS